jgi:hypothetical protein
MLGSVANFARYVGDVDDATEIQNRWFFYGQDTWRVTAKLTVNYGLRWDIYRPQYVNGAGKGGNVDPITGENYVAGAPGVSMSMNASIPPRTLAPRAGLAYKLTDKTVIRAGYGRGFHLGIFGSIFGHNVTQNLPVLAVQNMNPAFNFQSVFTLAQGPSAVDDPAKILSSQPKGPNGHPIQPNGFRTSIVPQTQRVPTVDTWNVTLQHQVTNSMSVEAAYVGTKGTHEPPGYNYGYDSNEPTLTGFAAGLSTNQRRQYFGPFGWTQQVRYSGNDSSNRYHSLQTKIEKRFSKGLQLLGHYTWSRGLDYDSTQYIYRRDLGFGPNNANRDHILTMMGLWEVPVGRGRMALSDIPKALDYVVGGWQVNVVHVWRTGIRFTPSYQNCSADQDVGVCRPSIVGDWKTSDPTQFGWFTTTTGLLSANGQTSGPWLRPLRGEFGNVGRNSLPGPHFWQTDFSMFKQIQIRENITFQFRAEAFNFFNHTNLGQPTACVDCPGTAGRIFATAATYLPRMWQLAAKVQF